MKHCVSILILACLAITGAHAESLVIQNATILTVSNGTIPNGSIVITDGKITAVGKDVVVPAGARVIDASGKFVMPGLIDCHSHIAVSGSVNEGSLSVTSMVGVEEVIDPTDIDIYRDLAGGVTTANVLHGSANAIGGKNAVIKLRWGKDAAGLLFRGAKPGIKFALGENPIDFAEKQKLKIVLIGASKKARSPIWSSPMATCWNCGPRPTGFPVL